MPRKPAPKKGNDRVKIAVAGGLGLLLLYLVFGSGSGSSDVADSAGELGPRRVFGAAAAQTTDGGSKLSRQTTPPAPVAAAPLPRLPLEKIKTHDPFTITAVLDQTRRDDIVDPSASPVAASAMPPMPVEQVQAVYKTESGSAALVEGQIVPVNEPQRLIDVIRRQPVTPPTMSATSD